MALYPEDISHLIFATLVISPEMFSTRWRKHKLNSDWYLFGKQKAKPVTDHSRFKSDRFLLEPCLCCGGGKNQHTVGVKMAKWHLAWLLWIKKNTVISRKVKGQLVRLWPNVPISASLKITIINMLYLVYLKVIFERYGQNFSLKMNIIRIWRNNNGNIMSKTCCMYCLAEIFAEVAHEGPQNTHTHKHMNTRSLRVKPNNKTDSRAVWCLTRLIIEYNIPYF